MIKNKRGDKLISVYWFVILFIVAAAVVYMAAIFYGAPKDIRNIESQILANKVADCFSEGGYLKENILDNADFKNNLLAKCNISFETEKEHGWENEEQYYLEVNVHDFDFNLPENAGAKVFEFSSGNIKLKTDYLLKNSVNKRKIDMIVIHYTASANLKDTLAYFEGNDAISIHYLIDKDGSVVKGEKEESEIAVHTNSSDVNSRSIGIEIVNLGNMCGATTGYCSWNGGTCKQICQDAGNGEEISGVVWEKFTHEQITALENLVSDIVSRYNIPVDREHIKGHSEIDAATRTDPGALFPWEEFMSGIEEGESSDSGIGRSFYVIDKSDNKYVVKILPLIGKTEKNEA